MPKDAEIEMLHSVSRRGSKGGGGRANSRSKSVDRPRGGRREKNIRENTKKKVLRRNVGEDCRLHERVCKWGREKKQVHVAVSNKELRKEERTKYR